MSIFEIDSPVVFDEKMTLPTRTGALISIVLKEWICLLKLGAFESLKCWKEEGASACNKYWFPLISGLYWASLLCIDLGEIDDYDSLSIILDIIIE